MSLELYKQTRGSTIDNKRQLDPARCAIGVQSNERWSRYSQCNGKAKYETVIDGQTVKVCGTHRPEAVAKREADKQARYDAQTRAWDRKIKRPAEYLTALRLIAAGHNDARAVAAEVLAKWGDGE